jgi:hypothetical protein
MRGRYPEILDRVGERDPDAHLHRRVRSRDPHGYGEFAVRGLANGHVVEVPADPDRWCDEEARTYFTELGRDPERIASLRQAFDQLDELSRTQEAMRRAFGSHLVVVSEEERPDNPVFGPLIGAVQEFIRTLETAGPND